MEINEPQVGRLFANEITKQPLPNEISKPEKEKVSESVKSTLAVESVSEQRAQELEAKRADPKETEQAVIEVGEFLQTLNRQLSFSVDDKSEKTVISVTDKASGDVIRQIPTEEILRIAEKIKELQTDVGSAVGILVNKAI